MELSISQAIMIQASVRRGAPYSHNTLLGSGIPSCSTGCETVESAIEGSSFSLPGNFHNIVDPDSRRLSYIRLLQTRAQALKHKVDYLGTNVEALEAMIQKRILV